MAQSKKLGGRNRGLRWLGECLLQRLGIDGVLFDCCVKPTNHRRRGFHLDREQWRHQQLRVEQPFCYSQSHGECGRFIRFGSGGFRCPRQQPNDYHLYQHRVINGIDNTYPFEFRLTDIKLIAYPSSPRSRSNILHRRVYNSDSE